MLRADLNRSTEVGVGDVYHSLRYSVKGHCPLNSIGRHRNSIRSLIGAPSVSVLSALPFASVVVRVTLSIPSPAVTVNVTTIPSSTERFSSRTSMTNGCGQTLPQRCTDAGLSPETFESPGFIK